MEAVFTKYHGPTNTRGARISATFDGKRIYRPVAGNKDIRWSHWRAASVLMRELDLPLGYWFSGATKEGRVWVWIGHKFIGTVKGKTERVDYVYR